MLDRSRAGNRHHHRRAVEPAAELTRGRSQALAERHPRHERRPRRLALLEHGLRNEEAAAELVMQGGDRSHRARARELLEIEIRDADVADFPFAAQLVERADRLLDRNLGIVTVKRVQLHMIAAQASEARVERASQVLRPSVAETVAAAMKPALRPDRDAVGPSVERLAEQALAFAVEIDVSRADQPHAEFDRTPHDPRVANAHRAEAEPADRHVAAEQELVRHWSTPSSSSEIRSSSASR